MSKYQTYILWIGLAIVLIYLFTDSSVRNAIFGRGASAPNTYNAGLAQIGAEIAQGVHAAQGENTSNPPAGSHPKIQVQVT